MYNVHASGTSTVYGAWLVREAGGNFRIPPQEQETQGEICVRIRSSPALRGKCASEGKPTERMGWRAMRKTKSADAVSLCETSEWEGSMRWLELARKTIRGRVWSHTWQWPLAACVVT